MEVNQLGGGEEGEARGGEDSLRLSRTQPSWYDGARLIRGLISIHDPLNPSILKLLKPGSE